MLVKVKVGDITHQFSSTEHAIAVLFTPKDKEILENMDTHDMLYLSAPFQVMKDKAADVWNWAYSNWRGATFVTPDSVEQLRRF